MIRLGERSSATSTADPDDGCDRDRDDNLPSGSRIHEVVLVRRLNQNPLSVRLQREASKRPYDAGKVNAKIPRCFTHGRERDADRQQVGDNAKLHQIFERVNAPRTLSARPLHRRPEQAGLVPIVQLPVTDPHDSVGHFGAEAVGGRFHARMITRV